MPAEKPYTDWNWLDFIQTTYMWESVHPMGSINVQLDKTAPPNLTSSLTWPMIIYNLFRICEIKGAIPDSASFYEPFKPLFF
jgi:hypothetical protein